MEERKRGGEERTDRTKEIHVGRQCIEDCRCASGSPNERARAYASHKNRRLFHQICVFALCDSRSSCFLRYYARRPPLALLALDFARLFFVHLHTNCFLFQFPVGKFFISWIIYILQSPVLFRLNVAGAWCLVNVYVCVNEATALCRNQGTETKGTQTF